MPAASLLAAISTELAGHAPFNAMAPQDLGFLIERLSLQRFPTGSVVLEPSNGIPVHLFIVRSGGIRGEAESTGALRLTLAPGEIFPVGALVGRRPVATVFRAEPGTSCYLLPASDFDALRARSPVFQDFCTRRMAALLDLSRRQMHAASAVQTSAQALGEALATLVRRAPITCPEHTTLHQATQIMRAERVGAVMVTCEGDRLAGIFTLRHLRDAAAEDSFDPGTPIGTLMRPDTPTLPPSARAFEAALVMARLGIHHVPVVDNERIVGLVSETDLFVLQRLGVAQLSRSLAAAKDIAALAELARDTRTLAASLLAQGVTAAEVTQIVSTLNDRLTRQVITLAFQTAGLDEKDVCWIALGSEGRIEQTLATDQDNGMIFADPDSGGAETVRARLVAIAQGINAALDGCGFPLCKGGIMAGNPKWCLSLSEWRTVFADWIDRGDLGALLDAGIFFDFRALSGDDALAEALRDFVVERARKTPRFLHRMAANALRNGPPLSLVRDFTVAEHGGRAHTLDLKLNGATPFIDAARLFALASGSRATGTAARFRDAGAGLQLPAAETDAWVDAFQFIQVLRLRAQQDRLGRGEDPDNFVDPESLNDLDRRILKEAFRQARKLQSRLALDYQV